MSIIAQGEPIIAHYRAKGLVHDIEGNQDINDVQRHRKSIDKFEIKRFSHLQKIAT